jgi:hypothetical protein
MRTVAPRARSAKFAESMYAHEFNDHIGIFSQDILFFTYYMTLRTQYREKMWSTPQIFIMNLAANEEKLRLKWLVQRALEEIYEVRGFYRGLKLRYEPHAAAAWPSAPRERVSTSALLKLIRLTARHARQTFCLSTPLVRSACAPAT